MSTGPFFREDQKAVGFRAWLTTVDHIKIDLPDRAFRESGSGVRACLVVIDKYG